MYTEKFETVLFDHFFKKIGCISIHQISLMKNIQSKF